ncbi:MAG TPA: sigma-70 family RNA polymerase sigma factor [Phycisphaerae bacterium]|nr:sigma-70 family RNA polymerase sigma factor [Phycisphaerae bacterium]
MTSSTTSQQLLPAEAVLQSSEARPPTPAELAALSEVDRILLRRLFEEPWQYVPHGLFRKTSAEKLLFGQAALKILPASCSLNSEERADGGIECTLTGTQEILIFQQLNYARMRVARILDRHRGQRMPVSEVPELVTWARRAINARAHIVQANMPLVLAMAKRTRLNSLDFNELISEGNLALLRCVDKFDCARGFKFSTYACRAILKSFSRVAMRTSRYRLRFPTEFDPAMEKSDSMDRKHGDAESACIDDIRDILASNRAALNDVEQTVIRERFGLESDAPDGKGKTLEQVGAIVGVTKERVRQIQNKALAKIKTILENDYLAA